MLIKTKDLNRFHLDLNLVAIQGYLLKILTFFYLNLWFIFNDIRNLFTDVVNPVNDQSATVEPTMEYGTCLSLMSFPG